MLIKMLDKIEHLEKSAFDCGKDQQDVLDLYDMLLKNCSDKNMFKMKSADMLERLSANTLSDTDIKSWISYASIIFGSIAAPKLYEQKGNHAFISSENLHRMIDFFRHHDASKDVASIGLYSCAQYLDVREPMLCYQLTIEAFSMNPHLSNALGIDYVYVGKVAIENLTEKCPFCGNAGENNIPFYCSPQILKQSKAFPPAKLWIKCSHCDNYYTYNFPLPDVGNINGHYTTSDVIKPRFTLNTYSPIFTRLKELSSGTDYLEVGIGNGEMLAIAQEFGYHADAVEICRADCERVSTALGVDVKCCDIVDYETEKQYDVIIMGDVFEHVTQPLKVLEKAKNMLKDDGVLWLSTPNYNCAYARLEKFSHCMWHELNHYTYVSYESLERLLHQMRMEVVHYDMSMRYIGSMELFIKKIL